MLDTERERAIVRYVSGESSPKERAAIQAWIGDDPERWSLVASLTQVWQLSGLHFERQGAPLRLPSLVPLRSMKRRWTTDVLWSRRISQFGIAAMFLLGIAWWNNTDQTSSQSSTAVANANSGRKIVAASGQRAEITLRDRSHVVLAPGSMLVESDDFGNTTRTVTLTGEAYFEVAPDTKKTFIVRTGQTVTRVLGTSFAIRAYTPDVTISVRSGRVAFGRDTHASRMTIVSRDQVARLDATGNPRIVSDEQTDRWLAWVDGALVFRDTPLAEAARILSRWYALDIAVDSTIAARPITATFRDETPDAVLTLVAKSLNVKYHRNQRTVRFISSPYTTSHP